jgi:hypothetical protein
MFKVHPEWEKMLEVAKSRDYKDVIAELETKLAANVGYQEWLRNRPERVRELIVQYPAHRFYVDAHSQSIPIRIFGVDEMEDGSLTLKGVSCHNGWTNEAVGGYKPENVVMLEGDWKDDHITRIKYSNAPQIFLFSAGIRFLSKE